MTTQRTDRRHRHSGLPDAVETALTTQERAIEPERAPTRHFTQEALARRWAVSPRTLERWRWLGQGPTYLKIGGRIVYRLSDVEIYEASHVHELTKTILNR